MTTLVLAALLAAAAEPSRVVAVATESGILVHWGPDPAPAHEVHRRAGAAAWELVARVAPARDRAEIDAILRTAADPYARAISVPDDVHAKAAANPAADAALAAASAGYARVRGMAWVDAQVAPGVSYRYRVSAAGGADAAAPLGEVEVVAGRTEPPPAPEPQVSPGERGPVLTWPGRALTAYHVQRADPGDGAPFRNLTWLPLGGARLEQPMRFEDTDAPADGRARRYRVLPFDLAGRAGAPSSVVEAARAPTGIPAAPVGLDTTGLPGGIRLTWRAGGTDHAGFHLYRRELVREGKEVQRGPRGRVTDRLLPAEATAHDDGGVLPGHVYEYEATATGATGREGPPSAVALATPRDRTPPALPRGLAAAVGRDARVRLTWAGNGEGDLDGYRVYRAVGREPLHLAARVTAKRGEPGSWEDVLDARSRDPYRYAVAAVDDTENEGPRTEVVEVRLPDVVPPRRPIVTALVAGEGHVEVRWAPPPDDDVAGYHVERLRPEGGPLRLTATALPATARAYRDATAEAGVVHAFAVLAVDGAGNVSAQSEPRSGTALRRRAEPATPAGVRAVRTEGGTKVTWQLPPGAPGAMVYASAARDGGYRQAGGLVRTQELVLPPGAGPWFRLQAVHRSGEVSALTTPVEASAAPAPEAPGPARRARR